MGKKTLVAVGEKTIEKCISNLAEVDVLSVLKKREQIFDRVIDLNPQIIVLSSALNGKVDYQEIIPRLRELKPRLKIVFIYGEKDTEFKFFANFLVENRCYNILADDIDEFTIKEVVLKDYSLADVQSYVLSKEERLSTLIKKEQEKKEEETIIAPPVIEQSGTVEVLFVDKIIEHETVQTQVVGNIKIGVASLFKRSGCTHFTIELAQWLLKQKKDVGAVVDVTTYNAIKDYYMLEEINSHIILDKLDIYANPTYAVNEHRCIVYDVGIIDESADNTFYFEMNCKALLCPCSPWEIDRLSQFVNRNVYAKKLDFVFYPVSEKYFKELNTNLRRNGCRSYRIQFNPDFLQPCKENFVVYKNITLGIINSL